MKARFIVGGVLVVALLIPAATYRHIEQGMKREVDLTASDRPSAGAGRNFLLVGSDSRKGLSEKEMKRLRTGSAEGKRTDTMMVVHQGQYGTTVLSLPRDSWVTIPAFTGESGKRYPASQNKLNAAYAWGGGSLLTRTIEHSTGIRIDHYAEIGFKGFADVVDALGGVEMDIKKPIKDRNSGANFEAGTQRLTGAQALAYVRQRYQEPTGDLGRNANQQEFLKAISREVGPSNVLGVLGPALESVVFDKDLEPWELARFAASFTGTIYRATIPVANMGYETPAGSAVLWESAGAAALFDKIKHDRKVTG
ncbi:LCP family protein [Streptomyces sp. NPDC002120]|uniref:LCP family protein n=1 Tax=Streptomyces sp. NPDC002120 TaxID=3364631 RepID=UPI00369BD56B